MRLDKLLADAGYGTRSEVKELVRKGRVRVNGNVVKDSGMAVSGTDEISVAKTASKQEQPDSGPAGGTLRTADVTGKHWYMLNKPAGVVSANVDKRDRTVMDLFRQEPVKSLFTVGRLDKDTEGLLLVTDDGELGHYLLAPGREVEKTYYAGIRGVLKTEHIEAFRRGFEFKEFTSKPAVLEILSKDEAAGTSEALVTVTEGKFHEVKRLVAAVGCEVTYLRRVRFAGLELDASLEPGGYRKLTESEVEGLWEAVGKKPSE